MPVVKLAGVETAVRTQLDRKQALGRPHSSVQAFLKDYFPDDWDAIQRCSAGARFYRSLDGKGRIKVNPVRCHRLPFCIGCAEAQAIRRTNQALRKFQKWSPKDAKARFIPLVQTAMVAPNGDGSYDGWGMEARKDVAKFGRVLWAALEEIYGEGIGAVVSYHDFGEQGRAKPHPHLDLTLNGWQLVDGGARKTPAYDLSGSGDRRWIETVKHHAEAHFDKKVATNLDLRKPRMGVKKYYRALRYQMRELVDFRKLEYMPSKKLVYWTSYRENRRTPLSVDDFLDRFQEYQSRLGQWGSYQARRLHRNYGHMGDRVVNRTMDAMGGEDPGHGDRCPCAKCEDWERISLAYIERMGQEA